MARPIRSWKYFVRKYGLTEHSGAYYGATHITGLTHAIKKFNKLARAFDMRGFQELEDALYEGAVLIQNSARSKVNIKTGNLQRSIVAKRFQKKRRGAPAAFVAIDRKIGEGAGGHAHLVEYGTAPRSTASGAFRGVMPKKPFMRPAVDENRYAVIAKVRKKMSDMVHRAAMG